MSGIYGFAGISLDISGQHVLGVMGEGEPAAELAGRRHWLAPDGLVGLGASYPARFAQAGNLAVDEQAGLVCAVDGFIWRTAVGQDHLLDPQPALTILRRYQARAAAGLRDLRDLRGSYNIALWDEQAGRLLLASDLLGQRTLFYTLQNGRLLFAATIDQLAATGLFTPQINTAALAELITFENLLGAETLLQEVVRLPQATLLTFTGGRLDLQRSWRVDEVELTGSYDRQRLDALAETFREAVRRTLQPDLRSAITLTAGQDSRVITAAAVALSAPVITITNGNPHALDSIYAARVAQKAGLPHYLFPVLDYMAPAWLPLAVRLRSGLTSRLTYETCFFLARPLPFDAVLMGTEGDLARGFALTRKAYAAASFDEAAGCAYQYYRTPFAAAVDLSSLWQPAYRRQAGSPQDRMIARFAGYRIQESYTEFIKHYALEVRLRTINNKDNRVAYPNLYVHTPYLDYDYLFTLQSIPFRDRYANHIQYDLIRRLAPALAEIPHGTRYAPLNASPERQERNKRLAGYGYALQRRLKFSRGRWFQEQPFKKSADASLRAYLQALLAGPEAAYREYLRPEKVDPLLEAYFSGNPVYEKLVNALAVLEILARQWSGATAVPQTTANDDL